MELQRGLELKLHYQLVNVLWQIEIWEMMEVWMAHIKGFRHVAFRSSSV